MEANSERTRLRIRFTKSGDLRWISHRDLARVWERLLRRANLELAFSQGFHPKPKINFPSALALGIEALEEIVELEVLGEQELDKVEHQIREQLPEGMQFISIESPAYGLGKARVIASCYQIEVPEAQRDAVAPKIEEVLHQPVIEVQREKKKVQCDPSDPLFELKLTGDGMLRFSIPNAAQGAIRPSELLEVVGLGDLLESGAVLQRYEVKLQDPTKDKQAKETTSDAKPNSKTTEKINP